MLVTITQTIDRWAIRMACGTVEMVGTSEEDIAPVPSLESVPFVAEAPIPHDLEFRSPTDFTFTSFLRSPFAENNRVFGKLYRCGQEWCTKPAVILLHGWNGENCYYYLFPYLARRLVARGMNAAMIQLPYHALRKPPKEAKRRNFISSDLEGMIEATRQSLSDIASLREWCLGHGCPAVGLWGFSMGAWLAGLAFCASSSTDCLVLTTPVCRMDQVVQNLAFCEPIRRGLSRRPLSLEPLNLISHQPKSPPEKILIVEALYDLFAPVQTVDELWRAWGRPDIIRVRHGHISVLFSPLIMRRIVRWLAQKLEASR